jgi:hypothetical protein
MTTRVVTCQACGYLALRVATVMEAAAVAARYFTSPTDAVQTCPLAWGR